MSIQFQIKTFNELTVDELYSILQLRSEIFVVEQNCVYQDSDGKDKKAMHVIGFFEGAIVAYARIFKKGDYFENTSIGRVVVSAEYRTRKWGHHLMETAIQAIEKHYNETKITISAQLYLQKFYENLGFSKVSEIYLEDNIPHIEMLKL